MDINQILQSITGTADTRIQAIGTQAAKMQEETNALRSLMTTNVSEAQAVSTTAAQLAGEKAQTDFIRNKAIQEAATIFGMNADENNFIVTQRMAEYTAAEDARKVARTEYDKLAGTSLLESPVNYLLAQLKLPQAAARNNALVDARDAAAADIQTRQQLAQAQKQVTTVNTADRIRATALSEAENNRRAAEIQVRQAQIENSSKLAGQELQIYQLKDKAFDIQGDLLNKTLQVSQWEMSYKSLELQREEARKAAEERRAAAAERAARAKSEAEAKAERDAELAGLNNGLGIVSKFLGLATPMNVELWKRIPNPKIKQAWLEAAQTGVLGSNLLEGLQFVNQTANTTLMLQTNPGSALAIRGFTEALGTASNALMSKPENKGKKANEVATMATDDYLKLVITASSDPQAKQTLTAPQFDTLFNPYKAQHKTLITEPGLAENAVVKALKTSTIGANVESAPNIPAEFEQKALQSIIQQVRARTLGVDEAARQVNQYYSTAARKNFELYQYNLFGLPAQSKYVARIDVPGMFAEPVTADLMSFASTKTALAKAARSGMTATNLQLTQGLPPVGPFLLPKTATIIDSVLQGRE
jgi:hypothetical protein